MLKGALSFGVLVAFVSCQSFPGLNLPKGEDCWNSIEVKGKLLCRNTLLEQDDPNYQYDRFLGEDRAGRRQEDKCTNLDDFNRIQKEFIDVKKKYFACKRGPKYCE